MAEVTSIENLVHQESASPLIWWNKQQLLGHSEQLPKDKHDCCRYIVKSKLLQQLHIALLFFFCEALPQQEIVLHHMSHNDAIMYHVVHDVYHLEDAVKGIGGHAHRSCVMKQLHAVFPLCGSLAKEPLL